MADKKCIMVLINANCISGAEKSILEYLKSTRSENIHILALSKHLRKYADSFPDQQIYYLPFNWFIRTRNPLTYFRYLINTIMVMGTLLLITKKHKIDLLYANTVKSVPYGILLKWVTRRKLIWHVRDNFKNSLLNRFFLKRCDHIVCVSHSVYLQLPYHRSKRVLYGGINTKIWDPNRVVQPTGAVHAPRQLTFGIFAQITPWKNHLHFIQMAGTLHHQGVKANYLVVGDVMNKTDLHHKKRLLQMVHFLGLQEQVTFLGYRKDVISIMSAVDVVVHPASCEPFGRVIIEAMALAKPVVAYRCGGPAEIIQDRENGILVEPGHVEELVESVRFLAQNKVDRIRLGSEARKHVQKFFNMDRYILELDHVFYSA